MTEPGVYTVTIDNDFCFTTQSAEIGVFPLPINPFGMEPIVSCLAYPPYGVTILADNPDAFFAWNTGETTQQIFAAAEGYYSVTITTPFGCEGTITQGIESVCPGVIYVPNSFTPNSDGINDYWSISGDNIERLEVSLFNRWGEVFYQSDAIDFKWMGQRRDGEHYAEAGTYPYLSKVQLRDELGRVTDEQELRGFVTLVR